MVIRIFYALCGLSISFFVAFFLQCCRSASRKPKHVISELPISDAPNLSETARLFAQWEKEMAEFVARRGRSTASLLLIVASSCALLLSNRPLAQVIASIAPIEQHAPMA